MSSPTLCHVPSCARSNTSAPEMMRVSTPRSMTTRRRVSTVPSASCSPKYSSYASPSS
ncbi:hypothetical protein ACLESD_38755 [Pyxidicoccus sp. 3LFB2]